MTYSIVARDPETGELGVAVQTCWFAVGQDVPWAMPGVGAVATQSFTEVSYGPLGLELMRGGKPATEALTALLAADPERESRQVAMVDASGGVAVHTGGGCVAEAGSATGEGVTCQANMMERDTVWGAMLAAFGSRRGPLAERLLAALEAAEAEGGDVRGRQSAALLVVPATGPAWRRSVELRVDAHDRPVEELGRLLRLHRAYEALEEGNDRSRAMDFATAIESFGRAADLAPEDAQIAFWQGLALAGGGQPLEGRARLEAARAANPRWASFLRRIAAAGLFPNDPQLLDALLPETH